MPRDQLGFPAEGGGRFFAMRVAGDAGKDMARGVRRHIGKPRQSADPIEHVHDADEMSLAPIGQEEEGRLGRLRLREQQPYGGTAPTVCSRPCARGCNHLLKS